MLQYRTTAVLVPTYDGETVARTLDDDIIAHGAPLLFRLDRARSHRTAEVMEVLHAHGVLILHGRSRHPCFYRLDPLDFIDQDELD